MTQILLSRLEFCFFEIFKKETGFAAAGHCNSPLSRFLKKNLYPSFSVPSSPFIAGQADKNSIRKQRQIRIHSTSNFSNL